MDRADARDVARFDAKTVHAMSPAKRSAKTRGHPVSSRPILFLAAGLAIATVVLWSLITAGPPDPGTGGSGDAAPSSRTGDASSRTGDASNEIGEASGEIGEASREQLREILRQADDGDRPEAR